MMARATEPAPSMALSCSRVAVLRLTGPDAPAGGGATAATLSWTAPVAACGAAGGRSGFGNSTTSGPGPAVLTGAAGARAARLRLAPKGASGEACGAWEEDGAGAAKAAA